MKNNDKVLSEKMERLDTLSGGIVYGKEEAWDKLQARMDKKPAEKIQLGYWVAAAAVLLLMITIATVALYPGKDSAIVKASQPETIPATVRSVPNTDPLPVNTETEKGTTIVMGTKSKPQADRVANIVKEEKNIENEPPVAQVATEQNKVEEITVKTPAPITPIAKAMRIVHINDLENGSRMDANTPVANTAPAIALHKVPVVHISEVEREAVHVKAILRENRMTFGRLPFSKHDEEGYYSGAAEYRQPIHFIKFKTTQN